MLYENDDLGKDYLRGLKKGLGQCRRDDRQSARPRIVRSERRGRRRIERDRLMSTCSSRPRNSRRRASARSPARMEAARSSRATPRVPLDPVPAGLENSKGVISARWEELSGPEFAADPGMKDFKAFAAKYMPRVNPEDKTATPATSAPTLSPRSCVAAETN